MARRRANSRRERNRIDLATGAESGTDAGVGVGLGGTRVTFRLRDHTADVAVEAEARSLSDVFAAVADGLTAAMCDEIPPAEHTDEPVAFTVEAESREALLFDYLDQLIYERDVRSVLPVDNEASVSPVEASVSPVEASAEADTGETRWRVDGRARGVDLARVDAREVKAVTYSEMRLEESERGWEAYVVFDV